MENSVVEKAPQPHQEARSLSIRPQSLGSEMTGSGGFLDLTKQILWTDCLRLSARGSSSGDSRLAGAVGERRRKSTQPDVRAEVAP